MKSSKHHHRHHHQHQRSLIGGEGTAKSLTSHHHHSKTANGYDQTVSHRDDALFASSGVGGELKHTASGIRTSLFTSHNNNRPALAAKVAAAKKSKSAHAVLSSAASQALRASIQLGGRATGGGGAKNTSQKASTAATAVTLSKSSSNHMTVASSSSASALTFGVSSASSLHQHGTVASSLARPGGGAGGVGALKRKRSSGSASAGGGASLNHSGGGGSSTSSVHQSSTTTTTHTPIAPQFNSPISITIPPNISLSSLGGALNATLIANPTQAPSGGGNVSIVVSNAEQLSSIMNRQFINLQSVNLQPPPGDNSGLSSSGGGAGVGGDIAHLQLTGGNSLDSKATKAAHINAKLVPAALQNHKHVQLTSAAHAPVTHFEISAGGSNSGGSGGGPVMAQLTPVVNADRAAVTSSSSMVATGNINLTAGKFTGHGAVQQNATTGLLLKKVSSGRILWERVGKGRDHWWSDQFMDLLFLLQQIVGYGIN